MEINICVYGSFRKREKNNPFLGNSKYLGKCFFYGEMYDAGAFPVAIEGNTKIVGELYVIKHPGVYERIKTLTSVFISKEVDVYINNEQKKAIAYFVDKKQILGLKRIKSGDWFKK